MDHVEKKPLSLRGLAVVIGLLELIMIINWGMYLLQQMPNGDIYILVEVITALLVIISGYGLLTRRQWAVLSQLVLSGVWAYEVIRGIQLVYQHRLDFSLPFGALTDAILFPLVLAFAVFGAVRVWKQRSQFVA